MDYSSACRHVDHQLSASSSLNTNMLEDSRNTSLLHCKNYIEANILNGDEQSNHEHESHPTPTDDRRS